MKCPSCGVDNPAVAAFCFACGSRLERVREAPSAREEYGSATASGLRTARTSRDAGVGLLETEPFGDSLLSPQSSPTGHDLAVVRDTQPESRLGLGADTLIDLPPLVGRIDPSAELASGVDLGETLRESPRPTSWDEERGDPLTPRAGSATSALDSRAEPSWASEPSPVVDSLRGTEPSWAETGGSEAVPESAPVSPSEPMVLKAAEVATVSDASLAVLAIGETAPPKRSALAADPSWGGGLGEAGTPSMVGDDGLSFELRRVRRVVWTQRVLVVLMVLFLAGAVYFVVSGVRAGRQPSPPKVGWGERERGSFAILAPSVRLGLRGSD